MRFDAWGSSAGSQPWFRIGRVDVSTTVAVVFSVVASWIAWAIVPSGPRLLALDPAALAEGQFWRLITWPWADWGSLWGALTLFFLWYFGTELERVVGRSRMMWLLVGVMGSLTLAATLAGLVFRSSGVGLAGVDQIEFIVLLLWIAEYPTRRFLFNIPAWAFGAVLVGIQVLVAITARGWASLFSLVVGLLFSALVARGTGLLSAHAWIPRLARQGRPRAARAPKPTRSQRRATGDRVRLDELLDKINEVGIGGLSASEKRELHAIRDRLRGR